MEKNIQKKAVVSSCQNVSSERLSSNQFSYLVQVTRDAFVIFPEETFSQIKERVLDHKRQEDDYELVKKNWLAIERTANRPRFEELVAMATAFVLKHEKTFPKGKEKNNEFFEFVCSRLLCLWQDKEDINRVREIIKPVVATAMKKAGEIKEIESRESQRQKLYEQAGHDVLVWARMNPVLIFADPAMVAERILAEKKSSATQGMLRRQVIELVSKITKQDKFDALWSASQEVVEKYFTANPKELFQKGETEEQFKTLSEKVRLASDDFLFIGAKYELIVTISRAIFEKREEVAAKFREKQSNELLTEGLERINQFKEKTGPKNPGSAKRRHPRRN